MFGYLELYLSRIFIKIAYAERLKIVLQISSFYYTYMYTIN